MPSSRVSQILREIVDGHLDSAALPDRLVLSCARSLPRSGVGLMLMTDAGPAGMVATTVGAASMLEQLQSTLGQGPGVDSSRSGRPILVADLAPSDQPRWPTFRVGALNAGVCAVFAFPLRVGGVRMGMLSLYREQAGMLPDAALAEALAFADAATIILLYQQAQRVSTHARPRTTPTAEDRAQVHQATGMVSVQAGVSLVHALVLLRARAFAAEQPISTLARDVLVGVTRFANDDGPILGAFGAP